jgi:hypothetical protein
MPTPTYTPLATVTLGTTASSVTFSSIPATYRDLIIVTDLISVTAGSTVLLSINSSTTDHSRVFMVGTNTNTTISGADTSRETLSMDASIRAAGILQFMDYSATDKHKTILVRDGFPGGNVAALARRWANTSAITSVTLTGNTRNFAASSTFNLYGVIA